MKNPIYDAFDEIHATPGQKERTRQFLAQRCYEKAPKRSFPLRRYAMALACCVLVVLGMSGYLFYSTPVAAISVDVNPSVELQVNRWGRVVDWTAYNQEAQDLVSQLDMKNEPYEQAVQQLLDQCSAQGYLTQEGWVSICVVTDDQQLQDQMQQQVRACTGDYQNVECTGASQADHQAAQEAGVSMGKYRAYQTLQELDPTVTLDQVRELSMGQIRAWIASLTGEEFQGGQGGNGTGGQGNQYQGGKGEGSQGDNGGGAQGGQNQGAHGNGAGALAQE